MSETTDQKQPVPLMTWIGLFLALFGVPLVVQIFTRLAPEGPYTNLFVIQREVSVFAATGLLLLLIVKGEKLGLESIGLRFHSWGQSILWGLLALVVAAAVLGLLIHILSSAGIPVGNGPAAGRYKNVSLWVMTLMVVRAGIVEEICYRGYVIERLEKITGNWIVYLFLPLVLFALLHYKQGLSGIIIAFAAGGILVALYLKKRDLKANIITHFLVDFIPNVLIPALTAGAAAS